MGEGGPGGSPLPPSEMKMKATTLGVAQGSQSNTMYGNRPQLTDNGHLTDSKAVVS